MIYQEQTSRLQTIDYDNIYGETPGYPRLTRHLQRIYEHIYSDLQELQFPASRRVLEVGCSYGLLLDYLREKGWRAAGIDISKNAVGWARERGLECYQASMDDFTPPGKYDLILLIHVLEHLPDPGESLKRIKSWLSPGGMIYLRVPNVESRFVRRSRVNFIGHFKPFEHLYYFSSETMKLLLEKAGLRASLKVDGYNTIADILNSYLRSRLVLNQQWLSLNYEKGPERKKIYSLLRLGYEKIVLRALSFITTGPRDKEIVVTAGGRD